MTLLQLEQALARARAAGAGDDEPVYVNVDAVLDEAASLWYKPDAYDGKVRLVLHNAPLMDNDV